MASNANTNTSTKLYDVVFVLGGPGAGKGTQCARIVQHFGYVHLSAGELLRAEQARPDSKVGQLIDHHIRNGTIVPVEVTCGLLEQEMKRNRETNGKNSFLVDGFPRNEDNLSGWTRVMTGKARVCAVLALECADEVCVQRCLGRGASGSGRTDDNIDSLRKRLKTFKEQTQPIIGHYAKLGLVRTVDAGRSEEAVWDDVRKLLDELRKKN